MAKFGKSNTSKCAATTTNATPTNATNTRSWSTNTSWKHAITTARTAGYAARTRHKCYAKPTMESATVASKPNKFLSTTSAAMATRSAYGSWSNESTNATKTSHSTDGTTATNHTKAYCKPDIGTKKSVSANANQRKTNVSSCTWSTS